MAYLAIKGHATRGNEVIELLEMLGGKNDRNYTCELTDYAYSINGQGIIDWYIPHPNSPLIIFTLEEFLEKFPYKVEDRVQSKGSIHNHEIYIIKSMEWDNFIGQIYYTIKNTDGIVNQFKWTAQELMFYQSQKTMEDKGTLVQIDLTRELCVADEVEVVLGDYEFVLKDGKTYFIKKKPQYSKTYEECAQILLERASVRNDIGYKGDLLIALQQLLVCRDAYWKIAGEQMGLEKPWKPDWEKADERKYCIVNTEGNVAKWVQKTTNKILAFPTEEMRDAFYENFKDLIELVKELL